MFSGYESPVRMIMGEIQTQMENDCINTMQSYGFDINKDELARALAYDRDQYDKGYDDGYTKAIDDFAEALKEKYEEYNFDLCLRQNDYCSYSNSCKLFESYIDRIAEQLKEGGADNG